MSDLDPKHVLHGDLLQPGDFETQTGGAEPGAAGSTPQTVGPYEVLGELARGGMGVVLRARDPSLNREVALKLLLANRFANETARERFRLEAEALARLRHPHVVGVHASGIDRGRPYLVMSLVAGESLEQRLLRGERLSPPEAVNLGAKLAEALEHAHGHGVIHRDVKPANVLLTQDGEPLLTDFGLAKDLDAAVGPSQSGQFLGTPGFWPPEQLGGQRDAIGPRSDVYSLGATLYAALTGESPFDGKTVVQVIEQTLHQPAQPPSSVPGATSTRDLDAVIIRCLAKDPGQRFPSAASLAEALRGCSLEAGRDRRGWGLLLAVAVAMGAGAGLAVALTPGSSPPVVSQEASTEQLAQRATSQLELGELAAAWETCLAGGARGELLALAERALIELGQTGSLPERGELEGIQGSSRWRLSTLRCLLAGDYQAAAREPIADDEARLRVPLIIDLVQELDAVEIGDFRRSLEVQGPTAEQLGASFGELLIRVERDLGQVDLGGLGRYATRRCQAGLARLAIRGRDRRPLFALNVDDDWDTRVAALAPGSREGAEAEVAGAYIRLGHQRKDSQARTQRDCQRTWELTQAHPDLPPLHRFLASDVLLEGLPTRRRALRVLGAGSQGLASAELGLAALREAPELWKRYTVRAFTVRKRSARLFTHMAWAEVRRGRDPRGLVQRCLVVCWESSGAESACPPLADLTPEILEAVLDACGGGHPALVETLAICFFMARRPELARIAVNNLQAANVLSLRALLEAELELVAGRLVEGRALLEALVADPELQSQEAWAALAHARHMQGDEKSSGMAGLMAARASDNVYVPWRDPDRLTEVLIGKGWWPGR